MAALSTSPLVGTFLTGLAPYTKGLGGVCVTLRPDAPGGVVALASDPAAIVMEPRSWWTDESGQLQSSGEVTPEVLASDAPGITPAGFTYELTVTHNGVPLSPPVHVPATAGVPIDVASPVVVVQQPGNAVVEAAVAAVEGTDIPGRAQQAVDARVAEFTASIEAAKFVRRDLVANEDLNLLTTPGVYAAAPFAVSSTLLNRWDTGTGVYIVYRQSAVGAATQLIMVRIVTPTVATGNVPAKRATRGMMFDGTWTPWVSDAEIIDTAIAAKVPPAKPSATRFAALGDSLTDGGSNGALWPEAESWPARMGTLLGAGYTVANAGFSGATVGELLMRIGARPVRVVVPAGGIVHNGNATVQRVGEYGLPAAARNIDLTYLGKGVRLRASTTGWILDNYTGATIPAGEITLGPAALWSGLAGDTAVVWIGINDITYGTKGAEETVADHIVAGTQALVEWLTPRIKHVLILGVTPRSNEPTGSVNNGIVLEVNSRLRALYPGKFRSVLKYLQTQAITDMGLTATQADTDAVAAGVLPPSVLATGDIGHINQAAAKVIGEKFVPDALRANGWL